MDLECIILSEVSQTEKGKYCISLICGILKNNTLATKTKKKETHRYREQTSGYQGGEEGRRGNIGVGFF